MFRERYSFEQFYENLKYGHLPKRGEKGNNWTILMVILYNKTVQNYQNYYHHKGVRVIYPKSMIMETFNSNIFP